MVESRVVDKDPGILLRSGYVFLKRSDAGLFVEEKDPDPVDLGVRIRIRFFKSQIRYHSVRIHSTGRE